MAYEQHADVLVSGDLADPLDEVSSVLLTECRSGLVENDDADLLAFALLEGA